MTNINETKDSPLLLKISFNKLLEQYEQIAKNNDKDEYLAKKAKRVLQVADTHPLLREGFDELALLDKYQDEIGIILEDSFSSVLTLNEIKTASVPFHDLIFNSSERFKKIITEAGDDFELKIRNMPEDQRYIIGCTVILAFHYGYNLDFKRPFFYDIPDANGIVRNYKILYNADFMEILPTDKAIPITQEDVDELMDNFDNLELWKQKFPPQSYIAKGFVISNIFDVTADQAISELKTALLASDKRQSENFMEDFRKIFQGLFNIKDMQAGFTVFNKAEQSFENVGSKGIHSFLLSGKEMESCETALCSGSYKSLVDEKDYFSISDVDKYYQISGGINPYKALKEQGIKSAIFAPIQSEGELLGVLELVSKRPKELNSVNANKLVDVMPFIVEAVLRSRSEEENLIQAIIQNECTSIHPSVNWKFEDEAKRFLKEDLLGNQPSFKDISFIDVYPLYGQVDIKGSSDARNEAIQKDLMIQLSHLDVLFEQVKTLEPLPIYDEIQYRIKNHLDSIKEVLYSHSEQSITDFIEEDIQPILEHLRARNNDLQHLVTQYEAFIDIDKKGVYDHRRNYDESVTMINKKLAHVIDRHQEEAQNMFPHYFERYKTDGVEHNMYIGQSMVKGRDFHEIYLNNLRLWQLQVMCEMENKHYNLKPELPVKLDVASLILVYSAPLAIRFRMDEKKFDVDGTYNARYEIIKKRIDKSFVKGTDERLTQKGKIAIVYSQEKDELEYLRYIKFLQSKNYFTDNIEIVELEGLQGVSGLKAIRAEVLYKKGKDSKRHYTYEDLMEELKA
ncbi:GAF domain-containing protein [Sungkyunkwania multivorans]|uniref:GAF domain-containing protein n=1 Tax=Sungkyunkwania multivorans TaxID=1173618 RepID=A0ABW3D0B1_9FLAO